MRHGVVMMDLEGKTLSAEEHTLIMHPSVGGIIFFSRNYENVEQLQKLVHDIRATTVNKPFLLAVDHEGGRVWRFKDGFTRLGPARDYGREYDKDPAYALNLAQQAGEVMARELLRDPYFPLRAAYVLGFEDMVWQNQYLRAKQKKL